MNKDRRREIAELITKLPEITDLIDELKSAIEEVRDDEQEYFDNMPESFQYGDKGQAAEAAVGSLDEAISALEDFDADSITSALEGAAE